MSAFKNIRLLLWKNYLLQIRHPWMTVFEVLIPCIFIAMIAMIRITVEATKYTNSTFYESFDILHVPNITAITASETTNETPYILYYTPNSDPYKQIMDKVIDNLNDINSGKNWIFSSHPFDDEDKMTSFYLKNQANLGFLCGVVFDNNTNIDKELRYKLRFRSSPKHQLDEGPPFKIWWTQSTFPQFQLPGPRNKDYLTGAQPGYYEEGFLAVQHLISMASLNVTQKNFDPNFEVVGQRFPYPPYIDDGFLIALQFLFPIILMFSYIYPPTTLTKNLVLEKEKRLKESMKMMGLKEWMHWFAWFTKEWFWQAITVGLITLLLCIKLKYGVGILNKSDPSLVFVFFLLYATNNVAFSFLVSTFFSKANVAGVGTGVIFFFSFMPYFTAAQRYLDISLAQKLLTGLLHNTNMAFGAIIISMWEGNNVGIQWSNIHETATPDDTLTLLYVMLMFVFDITLYFTATWYISSVFPGEYGIPLKWYFPVTKSYWCSGGCSGDDPGFVNQAFDYRTESDIKFVDREKSSYFEEEPTNLDKGIQIKQLSKTFDGGDNFAVKDLNLNNYSGQITALLGHNGAGKTTTMSIITGLFPPSSGTAIVNGYDIRTEMDKIRSSLGICPQFDVLFDELTVEEHLQFFCRLKNVTDPDIVEEEITNMIELLALQDKRKAQSRTLSGGMKRKLSVGNALIGGSKIVILDEPTSGMDVSARRFIWDLLLELKESRTILLSTHFMEEADVLGDRIAIMANGKLQCCGSPLFLKKKYGAGYHLTISKKTSGSDVSQITQLIQMHIPNAKLDTSGGTELAYSLPNEETSKFESLFAEIEERQQELGIDSYGASITTMEEVFLKVGEYAEEGIKAINENKNGSNSGYNQSTVPMNLLDKSTNIERNTGMNLIFQQFFALLMKKLIYGYRNPFLTASQVFLPLIFTISSILISRSNPKPSDSQALDLNLVNFKSTEVPFYYSKDTMDLSDFYGKLLTGANKGMPLMSTESNLTAFAVSDLDNRSRSDLSDYSLHQPISAIFEKCGSETTNKTCVTALFNNQAFHTPGISLAFVDNAIIRSVLNSDYILDVINHPMPRDAGEILTSEQYQNQSSFQIAQNLMFAMSFLAASFAVLLVRERAIKGKHLQMVCGVRLYIFWTASYIIDFLTYIIPCCLVMLMYKLFNEENLEGADQQGRLFLIFLFHGLAMLPFVYFMSFFFDVPSTAYVRICLYNVILGIGTFLAVVITELPALKIVNISKILNVVFSIFLPNFCLGRSVFNLYTNYIGNKVCTSELDFQFNGINVTVSLNQLCTGKFGQFTFNISDSKFDSIRPCCKDKCGDNCFPWEENYLSLTTPGIGQILLWLCFQTVVYWFLIVLVEYNVFRTIRYAFSNATKSNKTSDTDVNNADQLDDDVVNETKRLQITEFDKLSENNALIIRNLSKNYGSFCAVDGISYGVRKGECFGLLGVNGAGKTTTFKMITGDEPITSGEIYVNGYDVKKNIQQVQRQIGYCPQFDGLLDQLTGKETLTLFSRLRGIKEYEIPVLIDEISHLLYFDMHIDKQVGKYSGGTKRKLSTAVALLGSPSVSFLDEPTTGVDPVARRCLWDALTKKLYEGSSIVLTSHSMEECEALCNRLIIMVNGKICCIGSPQHLKNKFGRGYTVQIKVSTLASKDRRMSGNNTANPVNKRLSRQTSAQKRRMSIDSEKVSNFVLNRQTSEMAVKQNTDDVKEFMSNTFPGCQLKSVHNNLLEYKIYDDKLTWSQIFGRIERAKDRVNIEDYSIGQTTLEQIFLSFARKQRESKE